MKLAIVGIFYDGYEDMWEDFCILFRKFWKDCPYELYIVNQCKEINYADKYDVKVIHAGVDAEFSKKISCAANEIEADYYLFLLEDFFLGEQLDKDVLDKDVLFMEKTSAKYLGYRIPLFLDYKEEKQIYAMQPSDEYTVVSAYNICEREFIKKCVGNENFNAWIFEGIYATAPKVHTVEFLEGCYKVNYNPLRLHHGAIQGKFLPQTKKYFDNIGYDFKSERGLMSKKTCFEQNAKIFAIRLLPTKLRKKLRKYTSTSVLGKYEKDIWNYVEILNLK